MDLGSEVWFLFLIIGGQASVGAYSETKLFSQAHFHFEITC